MELKMEVYSPALELLGILEGCRSLVYEEKAFSSGSFTLESLITPEILSLIKPDRIIWFREGAAGIVELIQQQESREGPYITVKGSLLTGILGRRILWGRYDLKGTAAECMARLVDDSCIHPTRGDGPARVLPGLKMAEPQPAGDGVPALRAQKTGGTLLEALEELGEAGATAFGVEFSPKEPELRFWTRAGVDRTAGQTQRDPVLFSTELDDVLEAEYSCSSAGYRNVALVAGEGEGPDRIYLTAAEPGGEAAGFSRRELWVDARDLQRGEEGSEDRLTPEEYAEVLLTRGGEKLAENPLAESFQATVRTVDPTYRLGRDFLLGDRITVEDRRLGIRADAVATAVRYGISREGESQELTLGYGQPTIYEKLSRKADR
ncbi:hypothetical protein D7X94_08680 [Acutalibacter sp. 1XD8-33]|uniref:siphovirus ReqiPepy6 Gp37-like family protein n=1 Tax=Acutalibacter sp. 1XD8-33 TaxID=2320081 RepID=UPI000EA361B1|nr:siphovirus ReqiPepy6 Gp37-like family protein [Acutalibacter sp. 1XD8-33]RKJ40211.1 hypothetical protein D7X94_08680 [Acutalibacter sp. 1XD8-33]